MSLINQMLKDLARRSKAVPNPENILSGLNPATQSRKKKRFRAGLIASSIVVMLGLVFVGVEQTFFLTKRAPTPSANRIMPLSSASTRVKTPAKNTEIIPTITKLTGMNLQAQKEITHLRLSLSQNPLYRLTGNGRDRLMLVLENTQKTAEFPLDTSNSAIKIVRLTDATDGSVKMILSFAANTELTRVEMVELNKLPELQIDVVSKNLPVETAFKSTKNPIKKMSFETSIEDEYQKAMGFLNLGQPEEAVIRLAQFLQKYPTYISARKSFAALLLREGKISAAEAVVDTGLHQQPSYPAYVQLKAQVLVEQNKIKDALALLEKAPPPLVENPDYHAFLAALYQREKKFQLAEKLYEQLLNVQPNNSIWWMGLGIARETLRKKQSALEAFKRANRGDTLSPELKVFIEDRIHALS